MLSAADFKPGERVRLVKMDDPLRKDVPIGAVGTVTSVAPPPVNVVNVEWDAGFSLNPCLDADVIEEVGRVFEIYSEETYGGTFYVAAKTAEEAYEKLTNCHGGWYLSKEVEFLSSSWTAAEARDVRTTGINVF